MGASLAFVTVLAMRAGLVAFGGTKGEEAGSTSHLLYYVLAFVVGYREESVRRLIKKIADTILIPGEDEKTPPDGSAQPGNGKDKDKANGKNEE